MRKLLALGAAALLVAVAGLVLRGESDDRLVGTWEIDHEALLQAPEMKEMDPSERDMALGVLRAMKVQIVFTDDRVQLGGPLAGMADGKAEVPYRIVKSEGSSVTIEVERNGRWRPQVVAFEGADRIRIDQDGRSMRLRRVAR
jgi:hypothetical protein